MVEAAARRRGVEHPMQGTIATTDGKRLWVFRYSSAGRSRSLFFTSDVPTLRRHYPQLALLQQLSDATRLVVSEPLGDRAGVWNEVPEASYGVVDEERIEILPFVPPRTPRAQRPAHVAGSWPA
jgi:glutamine amidotransferase